MGDRLAEIRARLARATPGPWTHDGPDGGALDAGDDPMRMFVFGGGTIVADYPREPRADANADLIAHAPDDLAYRDPADDLELAADLGATLAGERRAA